MVSDKLGEGVQKDYSFPGRAFVPIFGVISALAFFWSTPAISAVSRENLFSPKQFMNVSFNETGQMHSRRNLLSWFGRHAKEKDAYDWTKSTEANHVDMNASLTGPFRQIRETLDYSYHSRYSQSRQLLQDGMIESTLNRATEPRWNKTSSEDQWIIFTAGVFGAGKTHTIKRLSDMSAIDLDSFVSVDPDEIRRMIPEFSGYIQKNPEKAGDDTRKEAGMIAEVVTEAALRNGYNVIVDGSLRDFSWYQLYFEKIRESHPRIRIGIIHVTAPEADILERVRVRAKLTGRAIPRSVLSESLIQVPKSVSILKSFVDCFLEIHNPSGGTSEESVENHGMLTLEALRKCEIG